MAAMYGAAALNTVAAIAMAAAIDELEEYTDYLSDKRVWHEAKVAQWDMDDVYSAMATVIATKADGSWVQDYGMSVWNSVAGHVERLRYAIANNLGRCKGLERPSTVGLLVAAQFLAHEAASYTGRSAELFRHCKVRNRKGTMVSVANLLRSMTCRKADKALDKMALLILNPLMPQGADYLSDKSISDGCDVIVKTLLDKNVQENAIARADLINQRL